MAETNASVFYGTRGSASPDILFVGEAWGAEEEKAKAPFVGSSGNELIRMLCDAGLASPIQGEFGWDTEQMLKNHKILFANVMPARPPSNDFTFYLYSNTQAKREGKARYRGLFASDVLISAHKRLMNLVSLLKPKVVVAVGNYALWSLTEDCVKFSTSKGFTVPTGIMNWRGSQIYTTHGVRLVPIIHPAAVLRQWSLRYPTVHDLRVRVGAALKSNTEFWSIPQREFVIRPTFSQAMEWLDELHTMVTFGPVKIAVDIETQKKSFMSCIGFAYSKSRALCIPFTCKERIGQYWSLEEEAALGKMIRSIFNHPNAEIIGQNFIYDTQYIFEELFCRPKCSFDTMLAWHLCYPGTPKGLDYISSMVCAYHRYWKDDTKEFDGRIDDESNWMYNCEDCVRTYEAAEELEEILKAHGKEELFKERMALHALSLDMTTRGIKVNTKARDALSLELMEEMAKREAFLKYLVPDSMMPPKKGAKPWYRSPTQLAELFYDVLGIKPVLKRGTNSRTTDDEALETIMKREPLTIPICQALREYRSLGVYLTTFCRAKLETDGRMRCSFNVAGTETFRWSSSKNSFDRGANMQNVPRGSIED